VRMGAEGEFKYKLNLSVSRLLMVVTVTITHVTVTVMACPEDVLRMHWKFILRMHRQCISGHNCNHAKCHIAH